MSSSPSPFVLFVVVVVVAQQTEGRTPRRQKLRREEKEQRRGRGVEKERRTICGFVEEEELSTATRPLSDTQKKKKRVLSVFAVAVAA